MKPLLNRVPLGIDAGRERSAEGIERLLLLSLCLLLCLLVGLLVGLLLLPAAVHSAYRGPRGRAGPGVIRNCSHGCPSGCALGRTLRGAAFFLLSLLWRRWRSGRIDSRLLLSRGIACALIFGLLFWCLILLRVNEQSDLPSRRCRRRGLCRSTRGWWRRGLLLGRSKTYTHNRTAQTSREHSLEFHNFLRCHRDLVRAPLEKDRT